MLKHWRPKKGGKRRIKNLTIFENIKTIEIHIWRAKGRMRIIQLKKHATQAN